jgi:hypothetical protein
MTKLFSLRPSKLLQMLPLLILISCAGCMAASFQRDYLSMQAQPYQSSHPFAGAWEGSWHSDQHGEGRRVRAIISLNRNGKYNVLLEMSHFGPVGDVSSNRFWIDLPDVSAQMALVESNEFDAKTRLRDAYRSYLIAEAMILKGTVHGNSLEIDFSTNDALHQIDHGLIELRRSNSPAT